MKCFSSLTLTLRLLLGGVVLVMVAKGSWVRADVFGSGANIFTIDFVHVGNEGNAEDTGGGGGSYSSPYGSVDYQYRISVTEISQDMITKATNLGLTNVTAGAHSGNRPAANVSWYEAAAFVNWLNLQAGYHVAYNLTYTTSWSLSLLSAADQNTSGVRTGTNPYRHKDAYYFLASEDEWYKAAYHQNDGVTANYWDYATVSNTAPIPAASGTVSGTAVYDGQSGPADVNSAGDVSAYGTMAQNGNVWEWIESAFDGSNDLPAENRVIRGGDWFDGAYDLSSANRYGINPTSESNDIGFRIVAVPEPSTTALLLGGSSICLLLVFFGKRRKQCTLLKIG